MKKFVEYEDKRTVFNEVAARSGLPVTSVEKDFWVTWTLKELFNLPGWGDALTFKGGTSLSKGWKLIERFSEDIDVVIDKEKLGFGGEEAPDKAPSKKQVKKRIEGLKSAAQSCVKNDIQPLLESVIRSEMTEDINWKLYLDDLDPDKQTLLFEYPTVFPGEGNYVKQVVKIEMGARSDTAPAEQIKIQSIVEENVPALFSGTTIEIQTVSPKRTFWEKALLLHEERFRPEDRMIKAGMARHYYDVYQMVIKGVSTKAIDDITLFNQIVSHRKVYFKYGWVDYTTMIPSELCLIPSDDQMKYWAADYENMRDEMFYGEVPTFDEILKTVQQFQEELNKRSTQ